MKVEPTPPPNRSRGHNSYGGHNASAFPAVTTSGPTNLPTTAPTLSVSKSAFVPGSSAVVGRPGKHYGSKPVVQPSSASATDAYDFSETECDRDVGGVAGNRVITRRRQNNFSIAV